jgi:proteic killer suppression protein
MIKTFVHKGLEEFFRTGKKNGIQPAHSGKLSRQLAQLDQSASPLDMNLPGWHLHELKPNKPGTWSVRVNGNWRVTFKFENGDAILVDYLDYH